MTQDEAREISRAALTAARERTGDDEEAIKAEILLMMSIDARLHRAFEVLGTARLWEAQRNITRH